MKIPTQGGIRTDTCARSALRHERKLRRKIAKAHAAGRPKETAHWTRRYLESFDARLVATKIASRQLKPHLRPPKAALADIAANLDPWRGSDEPVIVHFKPKAENEHDFRPIMDFRIAHRALQYLIRQVLSAQADLHPNQYALQGGTHAAIGAVMKAMEIGYRWAVETDISDCYPSFDADRIPYLLPLPEEVTNSVIVSSNLNLTPGNIADCIGPVDVAEFPQGIGELFADDIAEARRGIPQGSAASPLVTEILLAPVISQLPECGIAIGYADNILLMARKEADAVSITKALRRALKAHPAGPLRPKKPKVYRPNQSVEFLGYRLKVKAGRCRARPSKRNLAQFKHQFSEGLDRISQTSISTRSRRNRVGHLARFVRSWTAAFSHWDGATARRGKYLGKINAAAASLGIPELED